jgi:hypothetical protein
MEKKIYILPDMKPETAIQLNGRHLMILKWIEMIGDDSKVIIAYVRKYPYASKRFPNGLKQAITFYCDYLKQNGNLNGVFKAHNGFDEINANI